MNLRVPAEVLIPYLSASSLSGFVRCAKQLYFRSIVKKKPAHQSSSLAFGKAWGVTIGYHLEHSTADNYIPLEELASMFRTELDREIAESEAPVLFEDNEDQNTLTETARRMIEVFQADVPLPERVLGTEVAFSISLVHPRDGEELSVPLIGAIDALVIENGQPVVWELKTAKRKYSSIQFDLEMLQPVVYKLGARALGIKDAEIVVLVTTKAKQPAVQVERLRRHEPDEIELYDLAEAVLRAVEAGVFPRNRSWACTTCGYRDWCSP